MISAARILVVDDEPNVRHSLERAFRNADIQVDGADSPKSAIDKMRSTDFHLVISDLKMPDMDGIQFLSLASEIFPKTSQILLSGRADVQDLESAISQCQIEHFVTKPWDKEELVAKSLQAIEDNEFNRQKQTAQQAETGLLEEVISQQCSLLPEKLLTGDWSCDAIVQRSEAFGGDVIAYRQEAGRLHFHLIDTAGDGVKASLESNLLFSKVAGRDCSDPASVLTSLNETYPFLSDPFKYAMVICGSVDLDSGRARIANAGFPAPLLFNGKDDDGDSVEIDVCGLPLGVMKDTEYHNVEFTLETDDKLIIRSDGMAETDESGSLSILSENQASSIGELKQLLETWCSDRLVSDDAVALFLGKN